MCNFYKSVICLHGYLADSDLPGPWCKHKRLANVESLVASSLWWSELQFLSCMFFQSLFFCNQSGHGQVYSITAWTGTWTGPYCMNPANWLPLESLIHIICKCNLSFAVSQSKPSLICEGISLSLRPLASFLAMFHEVSGNFLHCQNLLLYLSLSNSARLFWFF